MPAAAASPSSSSLRPLRPHRSLHSSSHHLPSYSTTSTAATSYRHEEDAVILELGSRYLRAGFEGESAPMCVMRISPENGRRVGDYRGWIDDDGHTTERRRAVKDVDEWCKGYELWNTDVRKVDVGLFEDKIERAIREIYNKYLLTDTGNSRIVLVLPSVVPHPALSALLSTIFNRWKHPSITLLPSATMAAVSAGLRSALVVDIGWEETVVTSIYEYREIKTRRSTRGMKLLMHKFALFLSHMNDAEGAGAANEDSITVDFDTVEEVVSRLAWCRRKRVYRPGVRENNKNEYKPELAKVSIPMPNGADLSSCLFGDLAEIVEDNLFVDGVDPRDLDDEELPVDVLVYNALLSLLPDARGMLMSRVIITGGGGEIPGVKQRIMDGVERLVEKYGWSPIRGAIIDRQKAEGGRKPKPKPAPQGWQLQQEPPPQQQQQQSGPPPSIPLPSIPEGEAAFHPSSAEHPRQLQLDQDQTDRPSTPTTGEDTILLASPPQTSPSPSSISIPI
ncbi:hypothetical protein KEM55_005577 [Ascosphaera atra]|nr:hypothetical protein KEM55_005577 [Ascosphaera atra]